MYKRFLLLTILFTVTVTFLSSFKGKDEKKDKSMTKEKAIDITNMDPSVKPGDNFYEYVNGTWIKKHPVPPEYSQYGAFTVLYEQNQKKLKSLIDKVSAKKDAENGSVAQKIRDFYNSGMDTVAIENAGIKPIEPFLKRIEKLNSKQEVAVPNYIKKV
jgi:putative endopeptidase